MQFPPQVKQQSCRDCLSGADLGFELRMAFQPIIEWSSQSIVGYEALVRGAQGEGAATVLAKVTEQNKYYFDQACRVKAIETATRLGLNKLLSINFMPNAVYNPETCIRATIEAADLYGFDIRNIMFEVTEGEQILSHSHLLNIFQSYAARGFITAIDDFGAGFAHEDWLHSLKPRVLKLDMALIRDIDQSTEKQQRLQQILTQCVLLGSKVLAEGVETTAELTYLAAQGIDWFQGYFFARPQLEQLQSEAELSCWQR
ncbi:EAL domain-containing protein [Rheinheimera texasensis]|uniref:EAL domain-containing protein n=1 Tax=Rheinheimera texasensis TaxID=306205 RepID=UPI0032B13456